MISIRNEIINIKSKLIYYKNISQPIYERIPGGIINKKYRLLQDWTFFSKLDVPTNYEDDMLIVRKVEGDGAFITVKAMFVWNGATCAPDFTKVIPGTIIHDAIYERLYKIAKIWNISNKSVRKWGDMVFNEVNLTFGFWKPLSKIYFLAVRIFGGIVKLFGKT